MRNRVERFFRYLSIPPQAKLENHIQGINNLKLFLSPFALYYQSVRTGR
jgi:hypothetical protein